MSKLQRVIDSKLVSGYLTALRGVGSEGRYRSAEVGPCSAQWIGLDLVVTIRHSRLGEYKITLVKPKVTAYYSGFDDAPVATPEAVLQVLPSAIWWVDLDRKQLKTEATNISGDQMTVEFDELLVDAPDKDSLPDDGRCVACGSTEFILQTFARTTVKATGKHEYKALDETKVLLKNASIHIRCVSCGTEASRARGGYELKVTGVTS